VGTRKTWRELRAEREQEPAYHAAYRRARQSVEIGRKVRELRESGGMTQAELAARMGSSQSVIARLEPGGAEPRFDTLARLAEVLESALIVEIRPREDAAGGRRDRQRASSV
jgi:transcriptional regulator with XRE-family HTH domain